jgi:glycosyltransferase involved in cell wall biosynthesis
LLAQHPDLKLVLVGDGPLRSQLQAQHPEAIFAGFQTGAALAAHYASADVFMFASQTETFGNVTLEAMASGLAVAAFDHAAAGQLIQSGVNGMLAPTLSDLDFELAVHTLLNSRDLMRSIAHNAHQTAQQLSWQQIVEKTETIFHHILAAHLNTQQTTLTMVAPHVAL